MPDTPQADQPTPVPTTVRRVTPSKKAKARPAPTGGPSLVALATASRRHSDQLAELQRQLAATQDRAEAAHRELDELGRQMTRLRFSVPQAKVPLSASAVQAAIKADPAQWWECLRDFKHGGLKLRSTAQICSQHYQNLGSFVREGLQLAMIDNPHVGT